LDISRAILEVLEAPQEAVHNEVFNLGDTKHNYKVKEIAEIVAETFAGCQVSFGSLGANNRGYRVSFEKIREHLPKFECASDARRGARQLYELFQKNDMTPEAFAYRAFTCLRQLEYLIRTWPLLRGWKVAMDGPGSVSLSHLTSLFDSRPWYAMTPSVAIVGAHHAQALVAGRRTAAAPSAWT
jgi:hypothetical protein